MKRSCLASKFSSMSTIDLSREINHLKVGVQGPAKESSETDGMEVSIRSSVQSPGAFEDFLRLIPASGRAVDARNPRMAPSPATFSASLFHASRLSVKSPSAAIWRPLHGRNPSRPFVEGSQCLNPIKFPCSFSSIAKVYDLPAEDRMLRPYLL